MLVNRWIELYQILQIKRKLLKLNSSDSFFDRKAALFENLTLKQRKAAYFVLYEYRYQYIKTMRHVERLKKIRLPFWLSFIRWMWIDFLLCKRRKFWGIYQFVALPGEGKTLSMVAHMERIRDPESRSFQAGVKIATNFNYKNQDAAINHWMDIISFAKQCRDKHSPCCIAIDEIHVTFDSSDWKSFPQEMLALLSFNRKFSLQFLCSSQMYERIPKKVRDIANYTVICKNILGQDRAFINYYFKKDNYERTFEGKKAKADFVRKFIATDKLYTLYDTLEQVDRMTADAKSEKSKKEQAFEILFGKPEDDAAEQASATLRSASS